MILEHIGVETIDDVYTDTEIDEILALIKAEGVANEFGVREFLVDHPRVKEKVFSPKLMEIITSIAPNCNKSIKSIYFDKPPTANWVVNWHQDLTINLTNQAEVEGFVNWRKKGERVIVQPNVELLESIFTIRIHLDDCTKENGALRIIEESHKQGVIEIKDWVKTKIGKEKICEVKKGGVVLMKPLVLHSSKRTENNKNRRVIHIEFTDQELPEQLNWKECIKPFEL